MADLEVGDLVFDESGAPTPIVATTRALIGRPCREVMFSDGTKVVADADHQWITVDKNGRRRGPSRVEVRTTDQIARTVRINGELNHHVPLAGPVQYPPRIDLPIEPYTFGAWLGDGTTTAAAITSVDDEIMEQISGEGYPVRRLTYAPHLYSIGATGRTRDTASGRYARNGTLSSRLRDLGLREGKYVPRVYLEAGVGQRLSLLQGLMDTDGFVDDIAGRCEFTSTNENLADSVVELAASLGFRPIKSIGRATLDGVDKGPKYRVKFTPDRPVFRLRRKLARQKSADARFHRFRAIDVVREVASVPVRCIQVASPRGVFLASRSFIPTHNSSLGRLGLLIHSTAGYVDPGWKGNLTLELSNVANLPIALYCGMRIGQISFFRMSSEVERPYGSPELRLALPGPEGANRVGLPPRLREAAPTQVAPRLNDAVDWARDLGGGTRVALIQAGTFRSDAGALFGPVPWLLWNRWVTDEIDDREPPPPGAQLPADRDARRAGPRRDRHRRPAGREDPGDARLRGTVGGAALETPASNRSPSTSSR